MKRLIVTLALLALAVPAAAQVDPQTENWFGDIAQSVHRQEIAIIAENGITKGCNPPTNSRFCPQRSVTRGEMSAFIRRASFRLRTDLQPAFLDIASSVFVHDINTLAERDIVDGIGVTNLFRPNWNLSRVEMARWMYKAGWCGSTLKYEQVFSDVRLDDPVLWRDVPYVWACWNTGVARGHEGRFFPNEGVKREEMASFIVRGAKLSGG